MKTFRTLLAVALALLLVPALHAITINEPNIPNADFPNSSAGVTSTYTYTLTSGTNTFTGMVTTTSDGQDNFKVVVPAGQQILSVTETISPVSGPPFSGGATFNGQYLDGTGTQTFPIGNVPLPAGTYDVLFNANFSVGNPWSMTITLGPVPDYSVTVVSGVMTVTDNSGNGDTMNITEQGVGNIQFATTASRTFRFNTSTSTSTSSSGSLTLIGINSIQVNAGGGNDTINIAAFANPNTPTLTIDGGTGNNTVNFNGNLTFPSGNSLTVSGDQSGANVITVAASAQIVTKGGGTITLIASKNIMINSGAVIQTATGAIDIEANNTGTAASGAFIGVNLIGATVQSTGGDITVIGQGGNPSAGTGSQIGVQLASASKIQGLAASSINVTGYGGGNVAGINRGVTVANAGSAISGVGDVTVTGFGGPNGNNFAIGVSVLSGASISSSQGNVVINATGQGTAGSSSYGLEVSGTGSQISATAGKISVTGTAGFGASVGIQVAGAAALSTPSTGSDISLTTDTIAIDSTSQVSTAASGASVFLTPKSAIGIDLGGAAPTGTLSLSDALLNRITTANLVIGGTTGASTLTPSITTSAAVSPAGSAAISLQAASINPAFSGTDVTVANSGTLKLQGSPVFAITSSTSYPQLLVGGSVNLNGTTLSLAGTTLAGVAGNTFTLVSGSSGATGTFAGLAEGALFAWPGSTQVYGRISYGGGASGHDVVVTLISALQVASNADNGIATLRSAVAAATSISGSNNITFASGFAGPINLASEIPVNGASGTSVTIDATGLSGGLTINGGGPRGHYRLFNVAIGNSLTLRDLTLANGGGSGLIGDGGAILSGGTVNAAQCTFTGNAAPPNVGGAIENFGLMTLTQCTFFGNSAFSGGAINNNGTLTLTQCTVAGNSAPSGGGGGIQNAVSSTTTLANCIVAGNTSPSGADVRNVGNLILTGANIVQSLSGNAATGSGTIINANPLLAPLGNYGGTTLTMPPLAGSPAIDAGSDSAASGLTTDQRGGSFARIVDGDGDGVAHVDIGAVEVRRTLVTTTADELDTPSSGGTGISLREAVRDNVTADIIGFAPGLSGTTITQDSAKGQIALIGAQSIDAANLPGGITIHGAASGNNRLFAVTSGAAVAMNCLTLTNGAGGAITGNNGTLFLSRCTFTGNVAPSGSGGAIVILAGTTTLTQCTLTGGNASTGGALYNLSGPMTLTHCTVSGNSATFGGGIYNHDSVTLTNSIVAGNSSSNGGDIFNSGSVVLAGANIIQSVQGAVPSGPAAINANPLLAAVASNGGPTQTMALQPGSPALDAVASASIVAGLVTDQRGFLRNRDGNGDGTALPDIGAFEAQTTPQASGQIQIFVTTAADESNPSGVLGTGISLREALRDASAGSVILFDFSLLGQNIALGGTQLEVAKNVTIDASNFANGIAVSGNENSRVFHVQSGVTAAFNRLNITSGNIVGGFPGGYGAGVYCDGALTLTECSLTGNSANVGAAGYVSMGSAVVTLNRCTVSGNSANYGAGFQAEGTLNATACTFANNTVSQQGGAISGPFNTVSLTHCTLSGNSAGSGGAIYNGNILNLSDCIVAGNSSPDGADIRNNGSATCNGANNIQGLTGNAATANGLIIISSPLLAPLGNYGGPTQTMALLIGSPDRDAATGAAPSVDQRNFAMTDGHPDVGAYEAGIFAYYWAWAYETLPASSANNVFVHVPSADFDNDGLSNLLEYAVVTDPTHATTGLIPTFSVNAGHTAGTISFPVRLAATDLLYTVQRSFDLTNTNNWTTVAVVYSFTHETLTFGGATATGSSVIIITDPNVAGQPRVFYRLKVSQQ